MKKLLSLIILSTITLAYAVAPLSSPQIGYTPLFGRILQTNGATSTWVSTSSLGISGSLSGGTTGWLPYWNSPTTLGNVATGTPGQVFIASSTSPSGYAWVATSSLGITGGSASAVGTLGQIQFTDGSGNFQASTATTSSTGSINLPSLGQLLLNNVRLSFGSSTLSSYFFGEAGNTTQTGQYNTAVGYQSLKSMTTGLQNAAFGKYALYSSATGTNNTAIGPESMYQNDGGSYNVAVGDGAGFYSNGDSNTLLGQDAGQGANHQSNYGSVVAVGRKAGAALTTGGLNTFVGMFAGNAFNSGANNTAVGYQALAGGTTGNNNVALGYFAGRYETASNTLYIDNQNRTNTAGDKAKALIYGTFDATSSNQTLNINASTSVFSLYNAGFYRDSTNSSGTLGMLLQTTGTGTQWVATSSLGIIGGSGWTFSSSTILGMFTATSPLTYSTTSTTGTFAINKASSTADGYLSSTDWTTFNNKQPAGSYITLGSLSASYPLIYNNGTGAFSTVFSTSTANSYNLQQTFVNASATAFTGTDIFGNLHPTGISNSWIAVDNTGKIIATTSPSGGSGTVTSVSLVPPVGMTAASTTCTGNCILSLSLDGTHVIPLTASTTEWATAYASTTNITPTWIRNLFSNTTTGLTYTPATGVTSLTSGYIIPTTSSTTNYDTFWATPSTRISAGTNLSWSGNTLNATGGSGNSAWTIGNGLIYNATSTDKVGIGTTTPTSTLYVQGYDGLFPLIVASSTGASRFTINSSDNVAVGTSTQDDAFTIQGNRSTQHLFEIYNYLGVSKFLIDNLGNVGIGSTTPAYSLGVNGTLGVTGTSTLTDLRLNGGFYDSTNSIGSLGKVLWSTGTSTLWVSTSTLGIVGGGGLSGSGVNGKNAFWTGVSTLGVGSVFDNGTVSGINATSSGTSFNIQSAGGLTPFNVASSSGSTYFNISPAGLVGIGTTTEDDALAIQQPTATTNIFEGYSSTGKTKFFINATGSVAIGTSTYTPFTSGNPASLFIDNTGNTSEEGIDVSSNVNDFFENNIINNSTGANAQACQTVTNASGTLTSAFGSLCINSPTFNNPQTYNTGGANDVSLMGLTGGNLIINQASTTGNLLFVVGGSATTTNTAVSINPAGTTRIIKGLADSVNATGTLGQLLWSTGTSTLWVATSTLGLGGGTPAGSDGQLQYNNSGAFGATTTLFWDKINARLGLGTSTPQLNLHIVGKPGADVGLTLEGLGPSGAPASFINLLGKPGASTNNWQFGKGINVGGLEFTPSTAVGGYAFGTPAVVILDNKNVGIGTSSPIAKLDVWGNLNVATGSVPTLFVNTARNAVGIGTTTATTAFTIASTTGSIFSVDTTLATNNGYIFKIATSSNDYLFAIQGNGNITASSTPPTLSSCGTSPSIRGTNKWGEVTVGGTATGCIITFYPAFTNSPSCTVTNQSSSVVNAMTYTISNTAITVSQTGLSGAKLNYNCGGMGE